MINVINEQITLVLEDLEVMTDPYQRAMVRTHLISALYNTTGMTTEIDELEGKDAIKTDIVKDEAPIFFEEALVKPKKESKKKAVKKEEVAPEPEIVEEPTAPVEVDVDPNTPAEEEVNEPIVVQVEDEEGSVIDLDITDAWNTIAASMQESGAEEETILELAQNLTAYNLMPIYATFENISDNENKMMLSYYLQEVGLDDINGFISELSDGQFTDVYEFVNNDNLEYVVNSMAEAMTEE